MAVETELKLRLSPADARRLPRQGLLRGIAAETGELENVYYDTPDDALHRRRIALRHRRIGTTWLITIKSAGASAGGLTSRAEWEYPCAPHQLDFSGVEDKALRQFLDRHKLALAPLFSTNFRRRTWLIEPHKDLSIELCLDQGQMIASSGRGEHEALVTRPICEIELELKHGKPAALFEIAVVLAEKLALIPENESKAQRARRLLRGIADTPTSATASNVSASDSPIAAFRRLAHDCLDHFLANAEGVRQGENAEYIHQARVGLRRLRALLKLFSPLLPEAFVQGYNERWRLFANQLGEARDFDVLIGETLPAITRLYEGHDAIDTFVEYARAQRDRAREASRAGFSSPALGKLTLTFLSDLAALDRHVEQANLRHFAVSRLTSMLKRIRRESVDFPNKSVEELHRLRIRFKRLRYAIEFFSPLFGQDALQSYVVEVKAMQDILGRINDLERALAIEAKAPDAARCDLVAGWLGATQRSLVEILPPAAKTFGECKAPW